MYTGTDNKDVDSPFPAGEVSEVNTQWLITLNY